MIEIFYAGVASYKFLEMFYDKTGKKVNILKNYYEFKDRHFENVIKSYRPYVDKIMLDSGAFSANNSLNATEAKKLKSRYPFFLEYNADFLRENIYRVFTYDFLFDQEGYRENFIKYLDLREVYKDICPVIHRYTESARNSDLEQYQSYNPPTIAIGQIISKDKKDKRTNKSNLPKLQETINSIKKLNTDCHLLGITEFKALDALQNYDTCDSASWLDSAINGMVSIFWAPDNASSSPIFLTVKIVEDVKDEENNNSFYKLSQEYQDRFFDEMKTELQLEENDFFNKSSRDSRMLANLYYSTKIAEYLNNKPIHPLIPEIEQNKAAITVINSSKNNPNPFANANIKKPKSNKLPKAQNKVTKNPF